MTLGTIRLDGFGHGKETRLEGEPLLEEVEKHWLRGFE